MSKGIAVKPCGKPRGIVEGFADRQDCIGSGIEAQRDLEGSPS